MSENDIETLKSVMTDAFQAYYESKEVEIRSALTEQDFMYVSEETKKLALLKSFAINLTNEKINNFFL